MSPQKAVRPAAPIGKYEREKIGDLRLDVKNPRLAEFGISENSSQFDILKTLWTEMAVQEIAMSIAFSGYFEHEPLFVERNPSGEIIVIEGNRRLAAVKLLLDADLRRKLKATDLPKISKDREEELATLPVIHTTRKEAWRYLGFKHVNGPATWGSYAKAQYIAFVHNTFSVPLAKIAEQIGDYNFTVERMFRGLMIVEQAEREGVFDRKNISKPRFHFNYIYTGMQYPGISNFIGLGAKGTGEQKPVPASKTKNLGELFSWLYGNKGESKKSVIRSQNPDLRTLDIVLQTEDGAQALRDGLPLDVALEISTGDERVFRQALSRAKSELQKAQGTLTTGFKPSDRDMLTLAIDIERIAQDLVDGMRLKSTRASRQRSTAVNRSNA